MGTDVALVIHDDIHAIWINPANSEPRADRRRRRRGRVVRHGAHVVAASEPAARALLPRERGQRHARTTSAAACRTTTTGAVRAPCASRAASRTATGTRCRAATASSCCTIRATRASSTANRRTATSSAGTSVTGEARNIRPTFANVTPAPAEGAPPFRWNWDTPMVFSPHEPGALLVAANRVFRSNDRGDSWTVISPDLTTNADRNEIEIMGVRNTRDRASVAQRRHLELADDRLARRIAEAAPASTSPAPTTASSSMSKDGGKTWERITDRLPGLPEVGLRLRSRAVAVRREHGVRHRRRASRERLQDLHLGQQRHGRDVPIAQRAT